MTRAELVAKVAQQKKMSKATVDAVFDGICDGLMALSAGDAVMIRGFGTFRKVATKARTGRNPKNGQSVQIESKQVLKFKSR